jgi:hypothetical protein
MRFAPFVTHIFTLEKACTRRVKKTVRVNRQKSVYYMRKACELATMLVLHTKNVPRSTLLHACKTTKKCIQFL